MAEIQLRGVTKIFDKKVRAVDSVNLTIEDEEFIVLLGPSGCGKTTLMRMIAGLEYPDEGRVLIGGRDVTDLPPRKRDISMVFQSYAVFPHLTVFDNVAFGLKMKKESKSDIDRRVRASAELVELTPYLARFPAQLSGGQRQRVAVARAIVMEPAVLLMDEPLSNLDALLRLNFRAELKKLVSELQTTTIYVTHDQVEALSLGDRIAVMRAGKLIQEGTPMEVYDRPATEFVGSFIGNPPMNFLAGVVHVHGETVSVAVGDSLLPAPAELRASADTEVLVGIRAENIIAEESETQGGIAAETLVVEPLGSHLLVTSAIGNQRLKVMARSDSAIKPGDRLWLVPEHDKLRWFDKESGLELLVS